MELKDFYWGKRVMVTGHTGFKGSWLCSILTHAGAEVTGYALTPPTEPCLFEIAEVAANMCSVIGDIRDLDRLKSTFAEARPEIVFHLAAQPLVRVSYQNPRETYETNVMGTVNVLECIRTSDTVKSFLNVTTDKVYENKEWEWGYRENEVLNGFDPYSNSKSCSELITQCYKNAFFADGRTALSSARAGNVIGGGDFAKDRIVPECVRAVVENREIVVRNPYSTRPYQYVLEALFAYLLIAAKQYSDSTFAGHYNVGPNEESCCQTGKLVDLFCEIWGEGAAWINQSDNGPHEAAFLKLDCSKLKATFGWSPHWGVAKALEKTVEWSKNWLNGKNIAECMTADISAFLCENRAVF